MPLHRAPQSRIPAVRPGPLGRAVEWFLPARMGVSFRWLVGAAHASNLGDGIILAAGPLLVASQTDSALLVSAAPMLNRLPWLVLGLGAGALADRVDRRRMTIIANLLRAVVLVVLAGMVASGVVSVWLVLAVMLVLGTAEVLADSATSTLLPSVVDRKDLTTGNARLMSGFLTMNQMVGPAIGASLFAVGMAWPFGVAALTVVLAAGLVSRMVVPRPVAPEGTERASIHRDVVEGLRWLAGAPAVRTLVITILTFNVTWAAGWGVLVVWAQQRVGLGPVGFGLLTTATAIGGVISILAYDRIAARWSLAAIMKVCLTLEVLMHLVLALTTWAPVAYATMFGFGLYAFVWSATSSAVRQRATPDHMMGRISSINLVGLTGGMVIGMPIGGLLADAFGITAPYWFAFAGAGLTLLLIWRSLDHIAHVAEDGPEPAPAA
ncbi:MFS transporter [Kytococcus sedentarius]|uniref:MFS transporter n=1 Tax=Kytococcus sedentarius TaxID=1276 RepID=UPI0035BC7CDC